MDLRRSTAKRFSSTLRISCEAPICSGFVSCIRLLGLVVTLEHGESRLPFCRPPYDEIGVAWNRAFAQESSDAVRPLLGSFGVVDFKVDVPPAFALPSSGALARPSQKALEVVLKVLPCLAKGMLRVDEDVRHSVSTRCLER